MRSKGRWIVSGVLLLAPFDSGAPLAARAMGQAEPRAHPRVDPKKVDAAIQRGVAFLMKNPGELTKECNGSTSQELVLWTYVHAGVPESRADFQGLLKEILSRPLQFTYAVSLQAMILEELDRVRHQRRIWECAQFLVNTQCRNGQWSYGGNPTFEDAPTAVPPPKRPVVTASKTAGAKKAKEAGRVKPDVRTWLRVTKRQDGEPAGDNSNSQYAALGLRACHDAGIVLPEETTARAQKWWRETQERREQGKPGRPATPTGSLSAQPEGWVYTGNAGVGDDCYGSMTAGAVGSLIIYDYIQGKPWKNDADVQSGLAWLAENFSVTENPKYGVPGRWHYYYLYALERAGILYQTDFLGAHDWYFKGAEFLLGAQRADGSWCNPKGELDAPGASIAVWDTCFAILFLKRATRPIADVASVDRFHEKK